MIPRADHAVWLLVTPAAVLILALLPWALWPWLLGGIIIGGLLGLVSQQVEKVADLDAECARLRRQLAATEDAATVLVPVRRYGPVPPQRTGAHDVLPVADEPTPIHDRVLIDRWIEDVQTWGEDAER